MPVGTLKIKCTTWNNNPSHCRHKNTKISHQSTSLKITPVNNFIIITSIIRFVILVFVCARLTSARWTVESFRTFISCDGIKRSRRFSFALTKISSLAGGVGFLQGHTHAGPACCAVRAIPFTLKSGVITKRSIRTRVCNEVRSAYKSLLIV